MKNFCEMFLRKTRKTRLKIAELIVCVIALDELLFVLQATPQLKWPILSFQFELNYLPVI